MDIRGESEDTDKDEDTYKTQMTVFGWELAVWPLAFTTPLPFCFASCVAIIGRGEGW